jgi:beta-phosphoglucomutase-like phosphatase (HAD superfamily)
VAPDARLCRFFLHVAARLGVAASECVVLEDAEKGVLAAHAAGMKVIAVPTPHTRGNDFSKATLVVSSLTEVTLPLLDSLG